MARQEIELALQTSGSERARELADSIKASTAEMEKFKDLSDWTNAEKEIQNIEAMRMSLAQLSQERGNTGQKTAYSERARELYAEYAAQRQDAREQASVKEIASSQSQSREQEIQRLYERIGVLNDSLKVLAEKYKDAEEKGSAADIMRLANAQSITEAEKSSLEDKLKGLLKERESGGATVLAKMFGLKELSAAFQFAGNIAQAGYTYRQDIANGNYVGASRRQGTSIASNIGSAMTSIGTAGVGASAVAGPAAPVVALVSGIVAALGMGTSFVSRLIEGKGQAGDMEAQSYMQNFDAKYGALRMLRNSNENVFANASEANELFSKMTAAAKGTGLDAAGISRMVQEAARQGVDEDGALSMASNAGKWNQETGASIDAMLSLQSKAARYGLGDDVVGAAYGGLVASGMRRGQFDEFLNGLQSVIEDGISNGYLKTADEVTAELTMFARLSGGNPLWQGQHGAGNIRQMNAGLSSATSMGNVAQVIAMGSAKKIVDAMSDEDFETSFGRERTGTYLDYEMALQRPTGELYGQILQDVAGYSNGNIAAQKEFLQQIFGISSTKTLLELIAMTGKNFKASDYQDIIGSEEIKPNAKTEQTEWTNYSNSIAESLNKIGEGEWQKNIEELKETVVEYLGKSEKRQAKELDKDGILVGDRDINEVGDEVAKSSKRLASWNKGGRSHKNILFENINAVETEYRTAGNSRNPTKTIRRGGNDISDAFLKAAAYKYAAADDGRIAGDELAKFYDKLDSQRITSTDGYKSGDLAALRETLVSTFRDIFSGMTVQMIEE